MNEIRQKSIHAFKWNVFDSIANQLINLVINIAIARLLSPQDFGIFAIPFIFISLLRITQDFEHSALIVQSESIDHKDLSLIFWWIIFLGFILSIFTYFFSPFIIYFTDDINSIKVLKLLSITIFISAFYYVSDALLRKRLEFKKIFYINLMATFVSGFVGILLAYSLRNFEALVYKYGVYVLVMSVGSLTSLSWKPSFSFESTIYKKYKSFTLPLFKNQLLSFASKNVDSLLIGKFIGTSALGLYDRAYKFLLFPVLQVSTSFTKVMLPSLSKIKNEDEKIMEAYLLISRLVSLVTFPMMLGLLALSDQFVKIVFGNQWLGMIPILRVFCIVSIFQSLTSLSQNVFISKGKNKELLNLNLIVNGIVIFSLALSVFVSKNIYTVSYVYAAIATMLIIPVFYKTAHILNTSFLRIIFNIAPNLIAAVFMSSSVLFISNSILGKELNLWKLILLVIFGVLLYLVILVISKNKSLKECQILLKELTSDKLDQK